MKASTKMADARVVLVTCANEEEARRIGESLVLEKLAACANIVSGVMSIFFWQGQLRNEKEVLLILITRPATYGALEKRVLALHSYETPEVIALAVEDGSPAYLRWLHEMTGPEGPGR